MLMDRRRKNGYLSGLGFRTFKWYLDENDSPFVRGEIAVTDMDWVMSFKNYVRMESC